MKAAKYNINDLVLISSRKEIWKVERVTRDSYQGVWKYKLVGSSKSKYGYPVTLEDVREFKIKPAFVM